MPPSLPWRPMASSALHNSQPVLGCCGEPASSFPSVRNAGRRWWLSCAAVLAAGVADAEEAYPPLATDIVVEQVPGAPIYYVLGHPGVPSAANEGHTSNAGFVITDEGVVVFDTLGTPSLGHALLGKIRALTDKPARYVVLSHYHADHIYGLQAFRDGSDAAIVAQEKALDYTAAGNTDDEAAGPRLQQRREALAPGSTPRRASCFPASPSRSPPSYGWAVIRCSSSMPVRRTR